MEVSAQLNNVRLAPRKVRAVAGIVRKKDALAARNQLMHMVKRPASQIAKLIDSAIANAENNHRMVPGNLFVKNIIVDEGTKLKRYMPRAQGRSAEIQKKTSRVRVVLDERVAGLKQEAKKDEKKEIPAQTADSEKKEAVLPAEQKKPGARTELGKKKDGFLGNLTKRFVRRKAI